MTQNNLDSTLLLAVWREACRHSEVHVCTAQIVRLLAAQLPVAQLIVRRLNLSQSILETVAAASIHTGAIPPGRTDLSPEDLRQFLAWCGSEPATRSTAELPQAVRRVSAPSMKGAVHIGALRGAEGPTGVLIFVADADRNFSARDLPLLAALLEPFSVALENDRRLHETSQSREVAEADRRTLLAKLGRSDVGTIVIGEEAGLRPVMERVQLVAPSDVPVLLLGETGSGKEVIARAIHMRSCRAHGPFIRVNCGAIPPELIDTQLFGHERGSFTGATDTRKGWFERADGGTLFLDEIGDLPLAAQVRLLRVLQDGYLERVGAQQVMHVDVRVVGATHRDLAAMVRAGTFREDLWYRVAVLPIPIPPLRERPEDVPVLARYFAEKAATRFGLPLALPTASDIQELLAYSWPGNVREFAAVIDRAALLGNGRRLEIRTALGAAPAPRGAPPPEPDYHAPEIGTSLPAQQSATHGASLDGLMRRHIEEALWACHGRVEGPFGAAARLSINPHTLRSRMRKLGVDWRSFRKTGT
ncbi:MAG: sigma-54-dependent Fis family transcriptional regulator [Phycisphaerales bacterium]|nr:sigma-54-dependent Fis family transcriptional regulator [Phycisphaerales bacterium]